MNYLVIHMLTDEVIFASFAKKGGALAFVEASRHALDKEQTLASLLPHVPAAGSQERKIILSISPDLLFLREVELPIDDRRKVREILPMELKGETAVDTDELVFDALTLAKNNFLAVWTRAAGLREMLRLLTEHGLEPEQVTCSFLHWSNLLPEDSLDGCVALSDGDAVAVFLQGKPVYFRALAEEDFIAETARTLAAVRLAKTLHIDHLFLHGKAARLPAPPSICTDDGISCDLLPVTGDLAATFPGDASAPHDLAGAYSTARACAGGDLIDFRRGDLAYTAGAENIRKKLRVTAILAAALAVLLFAETGLRYYFVRKDLDSLNTSIRSIYREIFPTRKKPVDEVAEIRSEIKRLGGAGQDTHVLPVLRKLAELKGEEVLGIYETEIEGGQVRLKGDARSVQAVNDFRSRTAAAFSNAEVGEVKSRPDGTVGFVFRATVKGGEK